VSESDSNLIKHRIYLSHNVWGELKLYAFHERTSASDIVNYLVEQYLKERSTKLPESNMPDASSQLSIHRSHDRDEDRQGRSVYFRPNLWDRLQELAKTENFSVASLIENLLAIYLGLAPQVEEKSAPKELDPNRYVRVGGNIYDLGDNPYIIDSNTGQPVEKSPKAEKRKR
jgi:hypothetical protein